MSKTKKYTTVKIGEIITKVALTTEIKGYSESVVECSFPSDKEMEEWSKKQSKDWIKQNNERMQAICDLLNARF